MKVIFLEWDVDDTPPTEEIIKYQNEGYNHENVLNTDEDYNIMIMTKNGNINDTQLMNSWRYAKKYPDKYEIDSDEVPENYNYYEES